VQRWYKRIEFPLYLMRQNPLTMLGLAIVLGTFFVGAFAPWIAPYDPLKLTVGPRLAAPSADFPMGTDDFGRDILSRIIHATRTDLIIAFSSVGIAALVGTFLGSIAGYFRGAVDEIIMRLLDIVQSFPAFILAMGLAAALGAGTENIIRVVAFIMVPIFARLVRSGMLSVRERGYAEAARAVGASNLEIIFVHLLPNCLFPVLVQFGLNLSYAILDAAGLSFVGLGVRPPEPEWGGMIAEGIRYIVSGEWWMSFFPGLAIFIVILGFNLLTDGLRDVMDPKLRR
jgi:peptide/nickel transport system permease protein